MVNMTAAELIVALQRLPGDAIPQWIEIDYVEGKRQHKGIIKVEEDGFLIPGELVKESGVFEDKDYLSPRETVRLRADLSEEDLIQELIAYPYLSVSAQRTEEEREYTILVLDDLVREGLISKHALRAIFDGRARGRLAR